MLPQPLTRCDLIVYHENPCEFEILARRSRATLKRIAALAGHPWGDSADVP